MLLHGRIRTLTAFVVAVAASNCSAQTSTWSTEQPAQTAISSQLDDALYQNGSNAPRLAEPGLISQPNAQQLLSQDQFGVGQPTPAEPPADLSQVPFDNFHFVDGKKEELDNVTQGTRLPGSSAQTQQSPAPTTTPVPGHAVGNSNLTVGQGGYPIIDGAVGTPVPNSAVTSSPTMNSTSGSCASGSCGISMGSSCCSAPMVMDPPCCGSGGGGLSSMFGSLSGMFRNFGMGHCGTSSCGSSCGGGLGGGGLGLSRLGLGSGFSGLGSLGGGSGGCGTGGCGSLFGRHPWSGGGLAGGGLTGGGLGGSVLGGLGGGGLGGLGGGGFGGGRFYGGISYLQWWTRGQRIPNLVTTSTDGTTLDRAGALNWPNTSNLYGPGRLSSNSHSGGRFTLGYNFDACGCRGLVGDYFLLDQASNRFYARAPEDYNILARPFFNSFTGQDDAELVGFPGLVQGTVIARNTTRFQGGGLMFRQNLLCGQQSCCGPCDPCCDPCGSGGGGGLGGQVSGMFGRMFGWLNGPCSALNSRIPGGGCAGCGLTPTRVDALVGVRAYNLDESLSVREFLTSTAQGGFVPQGTTFDILDNFETENTFYGLSFGLDNEWSSGGRWGIGSRMRLSLGELQRRAFISGRTTVTTPGAAPVTNDGGLLALSSNSGSFRDDKFVAIPEVGFNLFYKLRPNARLNLGYTFVYVPDVWRPGDIIDTTIDPRLLPPQTVATADRPRFAPREDDFWAQGINAGVEFRY